MAGVLQDLLSAEEPIFSLTVRQLEQASNREGRDVRLIAEIAQKMRSNTSTLGLDPDDTTGKELYGAQFAHIAEDNSRVAGIIGGSDPDNVEEMVPLIVKAVIGLPVARDCWVLKRSVAKKILKTMPPKKLMKHLGYKSVDSMLKHESIDEIYTAIRFSEGAEWLNKHNQLLKTVRPGDFETREISIVVMDHKRYVDLADRFVKEKSHNIVHTKEMGTIAVVPTRSGYVKGFTLRCLPILLHYVNEIRSYSAFFKLKQVQPNFGEIVVNTLVADPSDVAEMAGQYVHWRVVQRYYGKLGFDSDKVGVFEPHIQQEDLSWRKAEEMLTYIDPEMEFWLGQEYVGKMYNKRPLTFNLMDVSYNYSNNKPYETRSSYYFRESLWNELLIRYIGAKNLRDKVLNQLDDGVIAPEELTV